MCARTSALREERGDEAAIGRARRQRGLQTTHTCLHFIQREIQWRSRCFTTCILETLPCLRRGEGVEAGKTRYTRGCRGRRFSGCPLSNTPPVLEELHFLLQKTKEGRRPSAAPPHPSERKAWDVHCHIRCINTHLVLQASCHQLGAQQRTKQSPVRDLNL